MEKQSDDIEQVFVVSDTEDSSGNDRRPFASTSGSTLNGNYNVSPEDTKKFVNASATLFAVFVGGITTVILISVIFYKLFDISQKNIVMAALVGSLISVLVFILFHRGDAVDDSINNASESMAESRNNSKRNKKRKKFNSLAEYRNSDEGRISQVAQEARGATLVTQASQHQIQKDNDDIELAVEALVRLGLGKRKAIDWVSRGIKSGIAPSETQKLVRFALSRGSN